MFSEWLTVVWGLGVALGWYKERQENADFVVNILQ